MKSLHLRSINTVRDRRRIFYSNSEFAEIYCCYRLLWMRNRLNSLQLPKNSRRFYRCFRYDLHLYNICIQNPSPAVRDSVSLSELKQHDPTASQPAVDYHASWFSSNIEAPDFIILNRGRHQRRFAVSSWMTVTLLTHRIEAAWSHSLSTSCRLSCQLI